MVMKGEHRCHNRLTVVGLASELSRFERTHWQVALKARYLEPLELSKNRLAWQFETNLPPVLMRLSKRHPKLTFLLEYDGDRRKGLVKAHDGQIEHHQVSY